MHHVIQHRPEQSATERDAPNNAERRAAGLLMNIAFFAILALIASGAILQVRAAHQASLEKLLPTTDLSTEISRPAGWNGESNDIICKSETLPCEAITLRVLPGDRDETRMLLTAAARNSDSPYRWSNRKQMEVAAHGDLYDNLRTIASDPSSVEYSAGYGSTLPTLAASEKEWKEDKRRHGVSLQIITYDSDGSRKTQRRTGYAMLVLGGMLALGWLTAGFATESRLR